MKKTCLGKIACGREIVLFLFFWLCFLSAKRASAQVFGSYIWTNIPAFSQNLFLNKPDGIASPAGETNRLFIVENQGDIVVITNLANPTRTVFLNILGHVAKGGENGMLGLAFDPGYATNGFFYVYYQGGASHNNPTMAFPPYTNYLSRFQVSAINPNQADTNSEVQIFRQYSRGSAHIGGDLHFGPDGYLYVAVGDETYYQDNAQRITNNLFSGILRIDVDKRPDSLTPNPSPTSAVTTNYMIPSDNPLVGATNFDGVAIDPSQVRTEFWAVGLREPWRFSFDPITGTLYCGDVGENQFEEVDIITKGGNYGWATFEGTNSPPSGISTYGLPVPQNPITPIITYTHGTATNQGFCVIGGVVYRGNRFPELYGAYVFGDFGGRIWASIYDGTNATSPLLLCNDAPVAFGTDPRNGDVLYVRYTATSVIQRLNPLTPNITAITCSGTNFVINGVGGIPSGNYYLLASTNIAEPITNWVTIATGQSDSLANFSFTNSIDPNASASFYRIGLAP